MSNTVTVRILIKYAVELSCMNKLKKLYGHQRVFMGKNIILFYGCQKVRLLGFASTSGSFWLTLNPEFYNPLSPWE